VLNCFNRDFPERRIRDAWLIYFAGLLNKLNQRQLTQACRRLGLRREEIDKIISYKSFSPARAKRLSKKNLSPSRIYGDLVLFSLEAILLVKARYNNRLFDRNVGRFLRYYSRLRPYLRGDDLRRLGLRPSPDYKRILNRLFYLQLDGKITSRQQALRQAKEWLSRY
jgi:tRNA nucleotidyltransferase (CCA-adding enzyme)